jgi:hypothetical protein
MAITFPLHQQEDLVFGIALLRFSYTLKLDRLRGGMHEMEDYIAAEEVARLPNKAAVPCKCCLGKSTRILI